MITLQDVIVRWNNQWRYDYWWRRKYNVSFNSQAHREASQVDIAIEYLESHIADEVVESIKDDESRKARLKETGQWIRERKIDNDKLKSIFDKLDFKSFK